VIPGVIIVLGSPNDSQGNLYSVGLERCEGAWQFYCTHPHWKLLLTGGFGAHFNTTDRPHAVYLQRRLRELGVPEEAFLPWAESRNTLEDASLSKPIVQATGARRAAVVTSDYHLERARLVFQREFAGAGVALEFIAAETNERHCQFDLAALQQHEREALARLKAGATPLKKDWRRGRRGERV
jgi:uncharacterized SAM-binding protein YcdF (DUF218 family)